MADYLGLFPHPSSAGGGGGKRGGGRLPILLFQKAFGGERKGRGHRLSHTIYNNRENERVFPFVLMGGERGKWRRPLLFSLWEGKRELPSRLIFHILLGSPKGGEGVNSDDGGFPPGPCISLLTAHVEWEREGG